MTRIQDWENGVREVNGIPGAKPTKGRETTEQERERERERC